jgi:hypothetical protein
MIPYYEWNELEGKSDKEEEFLKRKLNEGMSFYLLISPLSTAVF